MKSRVWLTLAGIVLCSTPAFAQTTLEEYNYVTKGYKTQLESGLDMKKGYRFEEVTQFNTKSFWLGVHRNTTLKALFREGETKPCALLCILTKYKQSQYICIPHYASSEEIWKLAFEKISTYSGDDARNLMAGFAVLASYYGTK